MKRDSLSHSPDTASAPSWGSDAIAATIRSTGVKYIALNPGASYRGLHDSLVNYLGNEAPEILLCLHEEHAVAIAHGYAKVTEEPIAVALHSNVGLMHATMAIFNAYCDRMPVLILGASGPFDASARRPWIDWVHSSADQGGLVRGYTKWDDQPASVDAAVESIVRASKIARTYPFGPTYVSLDVSDQERELTAPPKVLDPSRFGPLPPPPPDPLLLQKTLDLVRNARSPLLLMGRVGRDVASWDLRVRLAERLQCRVITDLKAGAAFPNDHPLNPATAGLALTESGRRLVREADVIVDLDWIDLGGTLSHAAGSEADSKKIVSCSMELFMNNGLSRDHFQLVPIDIAIPSHPDLLVKGLWDTLQAEEDTPDSPTENRRLGGSLSGDGHSDLGETQPDDDWETSDGGEIPVQILARELNRAVSECRSDVCFARIPFSWSGEYLHVEHPLDYLGFDGGGGLGSGPGMTVGAALALMGSSRIAVGVLGDGDFLMGVSAIWTAAHYELPMLIVVANNRTFMNDEIHQDAVARRRGRPPENRWIGQQIREPDPDLAALAISLGLVGYGPVRDPKDLREVMRAAFQDVESGKAVVVDVRIDSSGR